MKTLQQIANDIGRMFEVSAPHRARTIARTEVLSASSLGQAAAMEDAATVIPGMQKMWITAGDDRVRDSHVMLDGDKVDIDEKFDNGLKFPRDAAGGPEEVINCRCTVLMIPPGENIDESGIDFTGFETE